MSLIILGFPAALLTFIGERIQRRARIKSYRKPAHTWKQ